MDSFALWLAAGLVGMATFTAWVVRAYIAHLESDVAFSRKSAHRGTELAEKAVDVAERA